MTNNLFEELQKKKQRLAVFVKNATDYGWISIEREKEILDKLANDVLTIGVIGQMKCGKSTFLNSFVFQDNILPAATTPMTAALSVITYGDCEKIVAEFYTETEWKEQLLIASRSLDSVQGNVREELKVKAAKELVEKASKSGVNLNSYLGKTQEDKFSNLIEYVGADGKYISIVKSVTIHYPKEYLKGVEIVDTPGFNDPIISREERTKSFLRKADVVILMLYAGRPFDATDREILFQNVSQCGIGKVLIGINKYDIPYENGETEDEMKEYVKQEIKKACKVCDDDSLIEILKQSDPIPLSAEMALLAELPINKITANEVFQKAWMRTCDIFEISSQNQMREKSHLGNLTSAIKRMIEDEKDNILFTKPFNSIIAAGNTKKYEIDKSLRECTNLIKDLEKSDDTLDGKLEKLNKAEFRLNKKIESLADDIDANFKQIIREGKRVLVSNVETTCKKMTKSVESWGRMSSIDNIISELKCEEKVLVTCTLKTEVEELSNKARKAIKKNVGDFLIEVGDIIRHIPDFDSRDFIKSIDNKIQMEIEDENIFTFDDTPGDENLGWGYLFYELVNDASWGALSTVDCFITHEKKKRDLKEYITSVICDFDPLPFLESINQNKVVIIKLVKDCIITETVEPMRKQIEDIRSNVYKKDIRLKEAKANVEILIEKRSEIEKQLADFIL